jgi:hypothetical protein
MANINRGKKMVEKKKNGGKYNIKIIYLFIKI